MAAKKKVIATVAAVATSAALLLGGTMAWQSANQVALNEASDVINPGGRLHDDFNGENKDVYVENFAEDPIYARVRLEEYFEIITNYTEDGTAPEKVHVIIGNKDDVMDTGEGAVVTGNFRMNGEIPLYEREYTVHKFGEDNPTDEWWTWTTGGSTIYMPTFNVNKDSLAADLNGNYVDAVGGISDRVLDLTASDAQYSNYKEYTDGETLDGTEIYDGDTNTADEVGTDFDNLGNYSNSITTVDATHTAKPTGDATLMSMQEWIDAGSQPGPYWVYDTDGWVYWAAPIEPDTATGLLLDGIKLNQVMDDTWYYAINVVAQFITADDMGKTDGTGFYDTTKGEEPSSDALTLLKAIGVEVPITTQAELQAAFEQGGTITLPDVEINAETANDPGVGYKFAYTWTEGGSLNGGTLIDDTADAYASLFINNENGWPAADDEATAANITDTTFISTNSDSAIYTQALHAPITLTNVNVTSDKVGIWSDVGGESVILNGCTVTSLNKAPADKPWLNSAVTAVGGGDIVINSGTYTGDYAAYVYSTGGTIEINGGTFNGALKEDAGELIIKGGTFTDDPSEYVAEGYEAVNNGDGTWTVQAEGTGGEDGDEYQVLNIELNGEYWLDTMDITPGTYKLQFTPANYSEKVTSVSISEQISGAPFPQITQDENGNWIMTVTEEHNVAAKNYGWSDFYLDVDYTIDSDEWFTGSHADINVMTDNLILFLQGNDYTMEQMENGGTYTYNRGTVILTEDADATWSLEPTMDIEGLVFKTNEDNGERSIEWENIWNKYDPYPCTLTVTSGDQSITVTLNLLSLDWDSDY